MVEFGCDLLSDCPERLHADSHLACSSPCRQDGVVASSKSNGRKLAETTTSASAPLKATKGHYSLPLL